MTVRYLAFVFVMLLLHSSGQAQTYTSIKNLSKKLQKQWVQANTETREEKRSNALKTLDKILAADPSFIDAHILQGKLLHDQGELLKAEASLEKAVTIDAEYEPEAMYFLALIEWKADKFAESAAHFQRFLDAGKGRNYILDRAKDYFANATFAAEAIQNPLPYTPLSLGDQINTPESGEYWPSLTADETFLLYTKRIQRQEDLYYSQKIDGKWTTGRPFEGLNTPGNEGLQTISADGRTLIFTACNRQDGLGSCDLYLVEINANYFSRPVNLGASVNTKAWDSQPSLSADGQTLLFASERGGGIGNRDIWMTNRKKNGKWSTPVNLGSNINTSGGEQAPFMHPDGQTLYFMSTGHPGMGGFDLFMSKKQADGSWGKAQNLGYPINTKANEGALFINLKGTIAYFTSDKGTKDAREQELRANNNQDLYYFELPPSIRPLPVTYVMAKVFDAETEKPLEATAQIVELQTSSINTTKQTDRLGSFLICLPTGKDYSLSVEKEGYLFHSEHFALQGNNGIEPFLLEIPLQPIPQTTETPEEIKAEKQRPVILKNVFFETASAKLKDASRTELERLKKMMHNYPQLHIQINGHTDNIGEEADNQTLSEQRAEAVYQYLISEGVEVERLKYKGFGESQPIADNETAEGRQKNRRTEFVIIDQ